MTHENGDRFNKPPIICGAKRRDGGECEQAAGWGTDHPGRGVCRFHGGNTPAHRRKAQREEAMEALQTYGLPLITDPHSALLDELYRTAGHVAWLGAQVQEIATEELTGPVGTSGIDRESGLDHHPRAEPSVWVRLYQEERKHLASVAATCIKVGIEERKVRIAEEQGAIFATVIKEIMTDLGHNMQDPKVIKIIRRRLTLVGEGRELMERT